MDYRDIFSSRLTVLRKERKLTLVQLGDVLGIKNQSVSLLEKGKNVPSFDTLIALADYFNVSLDYLVGRSDEPRIHVKK